MRLFALADLHLSLNGDKPMDVFGPLWHDHARRMAAAWDRDVAPDDVVLLGGDLSWGRTPAEAAPDLEWIAARPGRKILLRGNHDAWWSSLAKVRRCLPSGCEVLQHNAVEAAGWVVVGARGWTAPDDPIAGPNDERVFHREVERLRLSVRDADGRFGRTRPRLALVHFPPWLAGRAPTEVVAVLREAGVVAVVYGHLHGEDHVLALHGTHGGMEFFFVAADAVGFTPVELPAAPSGGAFS